ncbi:FliG C-terminal domain-containing protein [Planctomicrobium sp. SH668]|uniref:FliG C-terminal domain-containing protein n=1 Tax=Planctomicrobium sp. SH668 TaxID=3448126 RepID=UPI003F5BE3EB
MINELKSNLQKDRVLTLLHLLGEEASAKVLDNLDVQISNDLRLQMKQTANAPITAKKQQAVLEDFERFLGFVLKNGRPELRLHTEDDEEEEVPTEEPYILSGDPLKDLELMNAVQVAAALQMEQPRTVALLLKGLTPPRVATLLKLLSTDKREAVVREMSRDPRAPEVILRRIAATTVEHATSLPNSIQPNDSALQRMVEVLRATEKSQRRNILRALESENPEQAKAINQALYRFEDIEHLDDQQIQKVLAKIDSTTLSTALFGAGEGLVTKILNNLSKRARTSLQEELTFRRNVSGSQLQASRELVTRAIAESEQESEG